MEIIIKDNENNLKSKDKFSDDVDLQNLVDYCIINNSVEGLNSFIRVLFFIEEYNGYELALNRAKIRFKHSEKELTIVCNIFRKWIPYEKYNLGECRGAFLEILSYKRISLQYPNHIIKQEINLFLEDYKSHTWDILLEEDLIYYLFECKFSSVSIKRSHLNHMLGDYNKLKVIRMFLIFFTTKNKVLDYLLSLQEDTGNSEYESMLNKFNIITIEDFNHSILLSHILVLTVIIVKIICYD